MREVSGAVVEPPPSPVVERHASGRCYAPHRTRRSAKGERASGAAQEPLSQAPPYIESGLGDRRSDFGRAPEERLISDLPEARGHASATAMTARCRRREQT